MIQTHLLDNVHRTVIRLKPDVELAQRLEAEEKLRLDSARQTMSEDDIRKILGENLLRVWEDVESRAARKQT